MGNTSSTHILGEVINETAAVLAALSPRDVPLPEVPALLERFVELERLAAAGRVLLAARAAESPQWKRAGYRSAAEWLASTSGTSTGRAKRDLQTSERLGSLDGTAAALRDGRLSPDQAEAVADAAAINPAAEDDLLAVAGRETLSGLKDEAARRKAQVEDRRARERRIHRDRRCRTWTDRDGAWNLSARGPAALGAAFLVELERLTRRAFETARSEDRHEEHDAYAFDALMTLASRSATHTRGDVTARADTDPPAQPNVRHLALVHVDLEALVRGDTEGDETCELPGIGPVSVTAARDLLGDSILKLVITRGIDVLNVTHLGRGPTAAQQIALLWSAPKCTVEGCNRRAHLHNDHRTPWTARQETRLDNLDPLCHHDHHRKTHHGWALVGGTGRRPLVPPDHPDHPSHPSNVRSRERAPNAPPGAA